MKSRITLLASVAFATGLSAVAFAGPQENHGRRPKADQEARLAELPVGARRTLSPYLRGAELKGVERSQEAGRTVFDVTIERDEGDIELSVDDSGELLTVEREVSLEHIPLPARFAIEKQAHGHDVEVDELLYGRRVFYEADLESDYGEREITVAADGSLVLKAREVELGSLPDAARNTIVQRMGKTAEIQVEHVEHAGTTFYEVQKKESDGKEQTLYVAEDGSIIENPHIGLD